MFARIKQEFFDIRREEWPKAVALSLFFFLVIAVFWILKPIKKSALIGYYGDQPLNWLGFVFGGAEVEQLAKVLNMVVVYLIVVGYTLLVRHFERQQVIYIFCVLISGLLVVFSLAVADPGAFTVWSFYVFGDIFNSIMVVSFWAFTNDVNRPDQAKRLYGIIGLGGVIGGAIGANIVQQSVENVGRPPLLLGSIAAMAVIAAIVYYVNRRADASPRHERQEGGEKTSVSAALEGARLVFASRYLIAIMGILGFYEIVSNIVEFQFSSMVEASAMEGTEIDAFFGMWGWMISGVSIVVQLLLTPYLMNRWSVGAALMVLPVVDLAFSGAFFLVPGLYVALALSVADNGLNYSINQSARESLYTPTSRDAKYKAKAFIDMFVQRFAKVLAVGLNLAFAAWIGLQGVRWLAVASIAIIAVWILVVRYAGRRFREEAAEDEERVAA